MQDNALEHLRPRKNGEKPDDKIRKENERLKEQLAKERKDKAKLVADAEASQAAAREGSMEVDADVASARGDVREEIRKLRHNMANTEENIKSSNGTIKLLFNEALAKQNIELQRLLGLQVEGRSIGENLRITDANIIRRERALGKIKDEGLELQDRINGLHTRMAELQTDFIAKSDELARDRADKARLLARQATEAAANLPAAAVQPAPAAAVPPTAEDLFNCVASLPGFGELQLQALRGIYASCGITAAPQQQVQQVPAASVQVSNSPVLAPAPAPTPVPRAEPPAAEGIAPASTVPDTVPNVGDDLAGELEGALQPAATEATPPAGQPTPQAPVPMLVGESIATGVTDSQDEAAAKAAQAAGSWAAALDEERAAKKGRKAL